MLFSFSLFILLIMILALDAFTAGLSYGVEKVHVPVLSVFLIAMMSGLMLTLSMTAGDFLLTLVPAVLTKTISFLVLSLLSVYKLYDSLPQFHRSGRALTTDHISRRINNRNTAVLSGKEACLLGLALSVDNISAGLCTGSGSLSPILLFFLTTAVHLLAIQAGLCTGRLLVRKSSHHFAWLGGAVLMLLSFLRLF